MSRLPADATTSDGKRVTLTRDDWLRIRFRHPEVGTDPRVVLDAVTHPDETHRDVAGGIHALKRIDERHFLVVIYQLEGAGKGGLIRTAFIINEKRKKRRYREP